MGSQRRRPKARLPGLYRTTNGELRWRRDAVERWKRIGGCDAPSQPRGFQRPDVLAAAIATRRANRARAQADAGLAPERDAAVRAVHAARQHDDKQNPACGDSRGAQTATPQWQVIEDKMPTPPTDRQCHNDDEMRRGPEAVHDAVVRGTLRPASALWGPRRLAGADAAQRAGPSHLRRARLSAGDGGRRRAARDHHADCGSARGRLA
jgi:hypothetical protein